MMKSIKNLAIAIVGSCLLAVSALSQTESIQTNSISQIEVDQILQKVTKNEDDFRYALTNYVFDRSAIVQTIGLGGLITGTYRRDSFMAFTKSGERFERVTYAPVSTLSGLTVTPEDLEDLGGVNPFAINPQEIPNYRFDYIGKQKIDDLNLHVFDVRPLSIPNPKKSKKRMFIGRIWVDDQDFMIVRSKGKGLPETKNNKYPVVDTWRINVDGKYWFPAYSSSDDELVFGDGQVIKMRLRVRYENYKQGRSEVIVLDDDVSNPDEDQPQEKPDDKEKP